MSGCAWKNLHQNSLKDVQQRVLTKLNNEIPGRAGQDDLAWAFSRIMQSFHEALGVASLAKAINDYQRSAFSDIKCPGQDGRNKHIASGSRNGFLRLIMPTRMLDGLLKDNPVDRQAWEKTGNFQLSLEASRNIMAGIDASQIFQVQIKPDDAGVVGFQLNKPSFYWGLNDDNRVQINAFDVGTLDSLKVEQVCSCLMQIPRKAKTHLHDHKYVNKVADMWCEFLIAERKMEHGRFWRRPVPKEPEKPRQLQLPDSWPNRIPETANDMPMMFWARVVDPHKRQRRNPEESEEWPSPQQQWPSWQQQWPSWQQWPWWQAASWYDQDDPGCHGHAGQSQWQPRGGSSSSSSTAWRR